MIVESDLWSANTIVLVISGMMGGWITGETSQTTQEVVYL